MKHLLPFCFGLLFLLAACLPADSSDPAAAPTGTPDPGQPTTPAGTVVPSTPATLPPGVEVVRTSLAAALGVSPDAVTVISYEAITFPDSCLGVNLTEEMCLQALTPGFRILFSTSTGDQWVHATEDGSNYRFATATPPAGISPDA